MDLLDLPKTELHLHLEGAIPPQALLQLIHKYGGAQEVPDLERLEARFRYRDFPHFIKTWLWMIRCLREYEDFRLIAAAVARQLAAQGVRYAELHFSPGDHQPRGLELQPLAAAIRAGFNDATADGQTHPAVRANLIVDLVRNYGPERGARRLEQAAEVADETGIVGIGIGGGEHGFPPEPYAPVYRRAEALGLHRVAHAGESAGPESIWGAVKTLGVERIGHGTRAFEDPALVAYLSEAGIPLEVCPTSNVCTGVVATLRDHPLAKYHRSGVRVTLSSDDPTMFGSDIVAEYRQARDVLGLGAADLVQIARTGFEVAFLSDDERTALLAEFDRAVAT